MSDTRFLFLFFAWNDKCYWIDSEILLSKVLSIGSAGLFCWHLRENLSLRAEYHSGLKLSRGIQSVKTETLEIISPCSRVVRGIEVVKFLRQASLSFDISDEVRDSFFSNGCRNDWNNCWILFSGGISLYTRENPFLRSFDDCIESVGNIFLGEFNVNIWFNTEFGMLFLCIVNRWCRKTDNPSVRQFRRKRQSAASPCTITDDADLRQIAHYRYEIICCAITFSIGKNSNRFGEMYTIWLSSFLGDGVKVRKVVMSRSCFVAYISTRKIFCGETGG